MESVSTPRISANMLPSYVGQNVIVVGKVLQLRGESALLEANGEVNAILNRESHLMAGNGAQIIGRVNPDLSVKVYNALDLGNNVDFQVAQSVVEITHQYKKLFVSSSSVVYSSSSSVASLDDELSQLAIQSDVLPYSQPATTQDTQSTRLDYQSTSPAHLTTAGSRYSSPSFSSTSSLNNELSQLVIEHDIPASSQFARAESYCSSSSEVFSSSSSLDNEHSQLVIEHDNLLASQLVRSESYRSSSSDAFSSSLPLDNHPSQPTIERDQPPSSQFALTEGSNSWQQRIPSTPPPSHLVRAASYCSSTSEVLSSVPDSLDDVFSQPAVEEETQPSSQSTAQSLPAQPVTQSTQSTYFTDSSIPMTPVHEPEAEETSSVYDSDSLSSTETPVYGSPSSTGKLSNYCHSPTLSPTRSTTHSPLSTSTHSPRLYRTRSGGLASLAELRQRREREEEAVDIVLRGILMPREACIPSKYYVPMILDESGRWRISRIEEPWGP
ncbi:replication factor A protein 3-domain-containing protein [Xylaria telfairii]|nr:replication factor A protein 3-domain-containing protein [Xylaria telfairii]